MNENLLEIIDIDQEGRGVARRDEKTFFIHNALIGEQVEFQSLKKKKNIFFGVATKIFNHSKDRSEPFCPAYNRCGGCSMQHFSDAAQINFKNDAFFKSLKHIGKVEPKIYFDPIFLKYTEYRHKARLRAKYVVKKDEVLVGFNERLTHFVTAMDECGVLPKHISDLIQPLKELIRKLSIFNKLPQIEYASNRIRDIFIFRILESLNSKDVELFKEFEVNHKVEIWTQSKGPDTVSPLFSHYDNGISYRLEKYNLNMNFDPAGFIQINPFINEVMVDRAIELLELTKDDLVLDFFSGLGNFTLPISVHAKKALGVEGSQRLVELGIKNGKSNKLSNVDFVFKDLYEINDNFLDNFKVYNKWLIDPPRDGALKLIEQLSDVNHPQKIVYISCNSGTLARDADVLINQKGYTLSGAGILNMFPNTSHIESISVFDYEG